MKGNARVLLAAVFLFFLIPLGRADRAAAEAPVVGRLVDSGPLGPSPRHGQRSVKPFLHHRGTDSLARGKQEAAIFAPTLPTGPRALVSSTVVTGFDGIDEISTFAQPPDGAIAVSPTYIVEAVNNAVSVWTKTYGPTGQLSAVTGAISAAPLDPFFANNPNCYAGTNSPFGLVSDPSLDYDVAHDRFMLSMISFDQLFFTSSVCLAVTETGDPTGNWFIYAFPISPVVSLLDFPRAVVGADGQIYLTGNLFVPDVLGEPVFDHARVYAFKTSDMYVGSNTTPAFAVVGNDPQTRMPADSLTPARAVGVSGMYFVSASNPESPRTGSVITLWKWVDPFGSNTFTRSGSVTVSTYAQPPNALQPGAFPPGVTDCTQPGAICITTNDARNLAAYWFDNTVWATHTVGCTQEGTPVACVQWYQLGSLDGRPALLQQGVVDDGSPGQYRYFPSLAVDRNGDVALAYAHSSATDYAGIRYTAISGGAQGPEVVLKAGEATIEESRYGDYAATALDPHDNLMIWHVEEYAKDFGDGITGWGTWISAIQLGGATPIPPSLSVTPAAQDFGAVNVGSSADRSFVVQNTGGGILTGSASTAPPFSIVSGGSFSLGLGVSQTVIVRFSPTATGSFAGNVNFTSNAGDVSRAVTGTAPGVSAITPSSIDLAAPPASFTLAGTGFANLGFGLPVANFMRGGTLLAQARATALTGSTTLTVPFPTSATTLTPNVPGLSAGPVEVQVFLQTGTGGFSLLGSVTLTVTDTRPAPGVSAITPSSIDLAAPPTSFTITGNGFANLGFGLPVANFGRNGVLLAQARATALTGSTTLTVPFPTSATTLTPNVPGLSAGPVEVQVFLQTGTWGFSLFGSVTLTVTDTRPALGVSAITPSSIDLVAPPASFTVTGNGFANLGFGLPVANFMRGGTLLAQARATALTGSTTLTVPFPTAATQLPNTPGLPGLSAGPVEVQVYLQTGTGSFSLFGSVTLTVTDTRPAPAVSAITPNSIDLADPPASFTITGNGFANLGFGLPVANFVRNGVLLAQARATALTGSTTLTVPFPTAATQLPITPGLPGLSAGPVEVQVYLQTGTGSFGLLVSLTLTVTDTRPAPGVSAITPSSIDLVAPPASFTVTGNGFANLGFGLPVANFVRGGTVLAQARASALTGSTTLTVPFPTAATQLPNTPGLPGLSAGPVEVQVFLQTGAGSFSLLGSVTLTITDTRPITPGSIDLAAPPASFTVTGNGFADLGFGLPVANFVRGGTLLAQARATALTGSTTLTMPFPTAATQLPNTPSLPGLSAGPVEVQVYLQTGAGGFSLLVSVALTVTDTRPIAPNSIDLADPPASFTIMGSGFANLGFGLPVANFVRGGTLLAQARATALTGSTTLTVPFPTAATQLPITPGLPGLSAGPVEVQVYLQTGPANFSLLVSVTLTVADTRLIAPGSIDLAAPPASFTVTGNGFANLGFGLPVANFVRGGALLAQARATALTGSTTLTVPFPTAATQLPNTPSLPGLSAGPVEVQIYLQTGPANFSLLVSVTLTVADTRPIAPSSIDLADPPASFTVTGNGFADLGFGLPVANFVRGGVLLAQARATALTGSTLTVPFPTAATALAPNLPGLSAGPVEVQVFLQTGAGNFSLLLSVTLTVTDTRSAPGVSAITPSSIHLAMHGSHGCRVCDGSPRDASA